MRILLINESHSQTGGAERYFFELKDKLKKLPGVAVFSIGFGEKGESGDDYIILKGIQHPAYKLLWRFLPNLSLERKLKKIIKSFSPDVIHLHNIKQYPISILNAVKSYPTVQTIHDHGIICPTGQNLHLDKQPCPTGFRWHCFWQHQLKFNKVAFLLISLSFLRIQTLQRKTINHFFAVSPTLADYMKKNGFHHVSYTPPFYQPSSHDPCQPLAKTFLFAGSLAEHKGIDVLIREFAIAWQHDSDLKLIIAGSGPDERWLKNEVKRLNLTDHIQFSGWVSDLKPYYQNALAFIFPSTGLEGFPLVMIDAMSHARPIIGVNRGTTRWLVDDNQTGRLFDPLKKGDLAEKILELANHPDYAAQMGKLAYTKLPTLIDNDNILHSILNQYQQLMC